MTWSLIGVIVTVLMVVGFIVTSSSHKQRIVKGKSVEQSMAWTAIVFIAIPCAVALGIAIIMEVIK